MRRLALLGTMLTTLTISGPVEAAWMSGSFDYTAPVTADYQFTGTIFNYADQTGFHNTNPIVGTTITGTFGYNTAVTSSMTNGAYTQWSAPAGLAWASFSYGGITTDFAAQPVALPEPDGQSRSSEGIMFGNDGGQRVFEAGYSNIGSSGLLAFDIQLYDALPVSSSLTVPPRGSGQFSNLDGKSTYFFQVEHVEPVPEPATVAMLGFGVLGLLGVRRRRLR